MRRLVGLAALALLAAGCAGPTTGEPKLLDHYDVLINNEDPVAVLIEARDTSGSFTGFSIPAGSWAWLPNGEWDEVQTVDAACTTLSAGGVRWGLKETRAFEIRGAHLADYEDFSLPTIAQVVPPQPSNLCPNGPHFPFSPMIPGSSR